MSLLLLFLQTVSGPGPTDVTMNVEAGQFALQGEGADLYPQAPDPPASTGTILWYPTITRRR